MILFEKHGGTTGAIAGDVVNNSALIFNRSDAVTFDNVISGSGSVSQTGPGTLTLTADNTFADEGQTDAESNLVAFAFTQLGTNLDGGIGTSADYVVELDGRENDSKEVFRQQRY